MHALFWIANGFDPDDDDQVDNYSSACLGALLRRYAELTKKGEEVFVVVINSVVRRRPGGPLLRDTMLDAIRSAHRVREDDVLILTTQTTGSVSDALAVGLFARGNPTAKIELFVTAPAVARHFSAMCAAVAKYRLGFQIALIITPVLKTDSVSLGSNVLYQLLYAFTRLMALSGRTFGVWYSLLNRVYSRRLRRFGRTVS